MSKRQPITRVRASSRDPLEVQVSIRAKLPKGAKPTRALMREAIHFRAKHGHDAPGITTRIIRWRNPGRKGSLRSWRQGNQADAWNTIAPFLKYADIDYQPD